LDTDGEFLKVRWTTPCDAECDGGCGLCKPTVIRSTSSTKRSAGTNPSRDRIIVIGDGVTDLKAASMADYVFARDKLLAACVDRGIRHTPFETFADICLHLQNPNAGVFHHA
jgi:2-hydroxy-3-keto-5-methylthiopentenyl-1-phosphate phosphatase